MNIAQIAPQDVLDMLRKIEEQKHTRRPRVYLGYARRFFRMASLSAMYLQIRAET